MVLIKSSSRSAASTEWHSPLRPDRRPNWVSSIACTAVRRICVRFDQLDPCLIFALTVSPSVTPTIFAFDTWHFGCF